MRISIITATFNSEIFITDCLKSVAEQDYHNIEHIIIDGGSSDATLSLVKRFPHISFVLSESDRGIYDAINKGIEHATGDLIGILNSDDFFSDSTTVSRIVASFREKSVDAVFSDVSFVKREDKHAQVRYYSSAFFKPWMFQFGFQPAHPTFYVRKNLFEMYGKYRTDLRIAGDFELLLRFLSRHGVRYKYVKDLWVKMRIGGISTSGVASVIALNREILKAHRQNELYSNMVFIYSKYLFKWWGFLRK
jgi:glycosyltransferase involved in cell wall biosynthesis